MLDRVRIGLFTLLLFSGVFAAEVSQFGIVLGGNYNWLWGADANKMYGYVDSTDFDDGRNPFGYLRSPKNGEVDPGGAIGIVVGLFSRMDFTDYFFIRVEANYLWKGAEYHTNLDTADAYPDYLNTDSMQTSLETKGDSLQPGFRRLVINNDYIEIPVLFGFNVNREISVFAGPHFSILIRKSFEAHSTQTPYYVEEVGEVPGNASFFGIDPGYNLIDFGADAGVSYQVSDQIILDLRWSGGFNTLLKANENMDIKQQMIRAQASFNFSEF